MASSGSLVLVHAHPDDEAFFTAGAARHYVEEGRRVVLITCTDGRLGLDAKVRAGNDPRHDAESVAVTRAGELALSVSKLGISRHVSLGYHDSGLEGWLDEPDPDAFVNADVNAVARTLASIFDEEQASVVVTYDENGYYGHGDHIQSHLVTRRAIEMSLSVQRLFYPVTPSVVLEEFVAAAGHDGVSLPLWVLDAGSGTSVDQVSVTLDVSAQLATTRAAIVAHASQVDNADLVTMDDRLFRLLFGHEHYQLGWARSGSTGVFNDLFGGL